MRLKHYISELTLPLDQEIWLHLQKNCSHFIEFYRKQDHPNDGGKLFYRGIKPYVSDYEDFVPRKNRQPLSSVEWLQKMVDDALEKRFGWRPRESSVFVMSMFPSPYGHDSLPVYGRMHLFFPYDGYKYLWSPKIGDLYSIYPYSKNDDEYKDIETIVGRKSFLFKDFERNLERWKKSFEGWMDSYQNTGLEKAIPTGNEIMFGCRKYVLVGKKYEASLIEKIWGKFK